MEKWSADGSVRLLGIFLFGQVPACLKPTFSIALVLFTAAAGEVVQFSRCVRAWREAECGFIVSVTEFKQCSWTQGVTLEEGPVPDQHLDDNLCVSPPIQHIL